MSVLRLVRRLVWSDTRPARALRRWLGLRSPSRVMLDVDANGARVVREIPLKRCPRCGQVSTEDFLGLCFACDRDEGNEA